MSREALAAEIRKARGMTDGALAVNFMGVLSNVDDLIQAAVSEGIRIIVYGAGLPTKLPALVPDPDISLVPIVSSARVANLIMRAWDKRLDRLPDGLILEGPLAGGHLGFSPEQLESPGEYALEILLPDETDDFGMRLLALSSWCQGYLFGFGVNESVTEDSLDEEARECLSDLLEISKLSHDEEASEAAEQQFAELVEHLRVVALTLDQSLRPRQPAPVLH